MTSPTIKTVIVVAGAIGTFAGGFFAARQGRAETPLGVELKLEVVLTKVEALTKDMQAVKCRLNIENVCPPER